jgi:hypothetical protein
LRVFTGQWLWVRELAADKAAAFFLFDTDSCGG